MSQQSNLHIIVIDDNPEIQKDFFKILTTTSANRGELADFENKIFGASEENVPSVLPKFQIDKALQGQEGVALIKKAKEEGNPYALAFVDIRMPPGWDGIETIKHIWEIDSDIQIVICTAYSDYSWEETVDQLGQKENLLILKKPFDSIAVRQLSCALTKKWQLLQDTREHTQFLEQRVDERTLSLKQSLSVTRGTLESSAEGMLVTDNNNNHIVDYNHNIIDMWKIPMSIIEKNDVHVLLEYISEKTIDSKEFLKLVDASFNKPEMIKQDTIKAKDDRVFEYYTQPYKIDNKITGRIWSFRDITKRAQLEEKLQYQADHDEMTGLPNRVFLTNRLHQALLRANLDETMFGVLFFDLDRFKLVNDSLSHAAGDELLRAVAKRLVFLIRGGDTLARLGGDEFVTVITSITNLDELKQVTKKLLNAFKEPFPVAGHELTVTPSVGISVFPKDGKTIDDLLRNADAAMYLAKTSGGNQFQFYSNEMNQESLSRLEMESDLRRALENDEFILFYQPQINVTTRKIESVEALIRWQHPTKGLILPMDFIPLAEETGLITLIGEWVLRTACKQNKKWQDQGYPPIRVSVNVASRQFKQPNLIKIVQSILQETGLKPEYLELEITENVIINSADTVLTITKLKEMGMQITLDDFGTGFSSLNYLRQISIDRIKIDQSFIKNIDVKSGDEVIIQAIVGMANNLNLEVLAEGVETQKQLNFLKSKLCGHAQGFYFSSALNNADLEEIFKHPELPVFDIQPSSNKTPVES